MPTLNEKIEKILKGKTGLDKSTKEAKVELQGEGTTDTDAGVGKKLSGVGVETSAAEDNKKGKLSPEAKKASSEDAYAKLVDDYKSDEENDNGDNARGNLTPKGALKTTETGGKLPENMKEHFEALFSGQQLTEEFVGKAQAIFEVAINHMVAEEVERLEEEFQVKLDEAVQTVEAKLEQDIDGYLDYTIKNWLEENQVAIESGLKVELAESFISGIKNVFVEHYVDVPESKIDVLESQASEIETLKASLQEANEKIELANGNVLIASANSIIENITSDMTVMESEKYRTMVESVEFDTIEEFESKAKIIKESYFGKKSLTESVATHKQAINEDRPNMAKLAIKALNNKK